MSEKTVDIVEVRPLRKMLQRFNDDLGQYINAEERYKLGRVLTIIDAAIGDPEQRKAIKDLVQNEWWGQTNRPSEGMMINPHTDLRAICTVLGFNLYEEDKSGGLPVTAGEDAWVINRYKQVSKED